MADKSPTACQACGAPAWTQYALNADQRRSLRVLAAAMELGDDDGWGIASTVMRERLSPQVLEAIALIGGAGAGRPMPVLENAAFEASDWASWASPDELRAWIWATFEALSPTVRTAFLDWATTKIHQDLVCKETKSKEML